MAGCNSFRNDAQRTRFMISAGAFLFAATCILGGIGASYYITDTDKVAHYNSTSCLVTDISYTTYYSNHHKMWKPIWDVEFTTRDGSMVTSTIVSVAGVRYYNRVHAANAHALGSNTTCWYDQRNPKRVQWWQPNPLMPGVLLMGLAGVPLLLLLFPFVVVGVHKLRRWSRSRSAYTPMPTTAHHAYHHGTVAGNPLERRLNDSYAPMPPSTVSYQQQPVPYAVPVATVPVATAPASATPASTVPVAASSGMQAAVVAAPAKPQGNIVNFNR